MAITLDTAAVTRTAIAYGPDELQLGNTPLDAPLVARQAVAFGGSLVSDAAIEAALAGFEGPELSCSLWDEDNATLIAADVTRVRGSHSFLDDPLAVGDGRLTVPTRNTSEETAADALSFGRVLRWQYRGQPAYPTRILAPETAVEQARLEGDRRRTVRVADLRSLFEEVKVAPLNGEGARPTGEQRTFSWASPEYDTSAWALAVERQIVVSYSWVVPNTDPPWFKPWLPPDGWPVANTPVISTTTVRSHAAQRGLLRTTYTPAQAGWYQLWCAAWWHGRIYLDGYKIGEGEEFPADMWQEPFLTEPFYLSDDPHVFGVELSKPELPDVSWAPGTLGTINSEMSMAFNLHYLDDGASTVIGENTVVLRSDRTNWRRLHNPTVDPAPTFGRWFWRLCTEAQGRDAMPAGVTRSFTDTHDSNGRVWPNTGPTTVRTADTYEQVLAQMQELGYRARFRYSGLVLDAFAPDSAGTHTGVEVETVRRERSKSRPKANRLRVNYASGQFSVEDTAAIAAAGKAIEDELQLADEKDYLRAYTTAQAQLEILAAGAESLTVAPNPAPAAAATAPYVAYRPLDWVKVNATDEAQVARIRVSEDEAGKALLTPDLYSAPESTSRRLTTRLARATPGTIGGGAQTSTITRWLDSGIRGGFATRYTISPFSTREVVAFAADEERGRSSAEKFDRPVRLTRLKLGSVGTVTSTVTVAVMKNAAKVDEMFLLPGIHNTEWLAMHHYFAAGDELWFRVDDAGAGAYLLGVQVVAVPASPAQVKPTGRLPWD